jgi:hypothetical protein
MKYLLFFLCLLSALATPALAGDPGDDFWALVNIRKANWEIDDQTTATAAALRANKVTVAAAASKWKELHGKAAQLKAQTLQAQTGAYPNVAKAMTKMMRLQILRLEGLLGAAKVEQEQGRSAAGPLWARQVITAQDYQSQEALVLDMMNWIEENP